MGISWPEYNPEEIRTWDIKKVKSTWYLIWARLIAWRGIINPPDYFGKLSSAIAQRGKELGIDLIRELIEERRDLIKERGEEGK